MVRSLGGGGFLCLGTYGDSREVGVFYERGTPVVLAECVVVRNGGGGGLGARNCPGCLPLSVIYIWCECKGFVWDTIVLETGAPHYPQNLLTLEVESTGVPRLQETAPSWDPTVGPCLGPYGGP